MQAPETPAASVLILPGLGNSGPEHWQSHWERRDPSCRRVSQKEWDAPNCPDWVACLDEIIGGQASPVVLAAHSSACALVAHWAATAATRHLARVRGALLVAPSDPDNPNYPVGPMGFGPVPTAKLPFSSIVVASNDDRYIAEKQARLFADAWGSQFVLLTHAGHINAASGYGPWDEGYALLDSLRAGSA
jgi:predicted alpha/beta hydrolase family esterase